jgi:hypothetical protein
MYYGQDPPQELPVPLDAMSEELKRQLTELGVRVEGFVSDQTASDPEFNDVVVSEGMVAEERPSLWTQVRDAALDADADKQITPGEIRVFAMGLISGLLISKLLR